MIKWDNMNFLKVLTDFFFFFFFFLQYMNCNLLDGAIKYKARDKKSLLHKKAMFSIKDFFSKFN